MSQVIIQKTGPLPVSAVVPWPSTDTVLVAVSGSVWSKTPATMVVMNVNINDKTIGTMQIWANEASMHLMLPTGFFPVTGGYGDTTVTLSAANGTTVSDSNDTFTVALIF
ncbi:hypothetical protein [Longimicrobium terrae]|uniref:Uncharacterized protein n=1 Tax=Longimicrobium terrae TaxID=1639882 RepID=A0A841GZ24_9BACT|nr:hypothetical protein [Longimicrobium terrae]MBB4636492.1 hypothetical protein [Longimicrobium terrae]MBB6070984.1 hypothetical protein [Longimicrobium terrae]NNC29006.1 hypothetical protein [Longimicrobium terrae]